MHCPSCAGEFDADQRFALMAVCPYCRSAVILDKKAAEVRGEMAVLIPSDGPLYVGGSGRLKGKPFTVLGRVRYGYEKGYWDEYYLLFEGGRNAWISEVEGNYTISKLSERNVPSTLFAQSQPGSRVNFGDRSWHVDEKDVADCEGGEGELPFVIVTGEKSPFLDLRSGKDEFATIEFDLSAATENHARVYRGRRVDVADIKMDGEKPPEGWGMASGLALNLERPAGAPGGAGERGEGRRERIVMTGARAQVINCFACGGSLEPPDGPVTEIVCPYCSASNPVEGQAITCPTCETKFPLPGGDTAKTAVCPSCSDRIDLTRTLPKSLGPRTGYQQPVVPFKVGQKCTFEGVTFIVTGHIRLKTVDSDGFYMDDEFLLYNKKAGYRWLMMTDGHFTLAEEVHEDPPQIMHVYRSTFHFLGKRWRVFESSVDEGAACMLTWVDGQLPYVAREGDKIAYIDCIHPPYLLSVEETESEREYFLGRYVPREEVAEAFKMDVDKLPAQYEVAPHQPYPAGSFRRQSAWWMGAIALLNIVLLIMAWNASGSNVGAIHVAGSELQGEVLTQPFTVSDDNAVMQADFHAGVDNSWMYVDVAVVNAANEVVQDFSAQMSYYHGYEGGYWSEGSKEDSVYFKLPEAGEYRLLMSAQGGTGETANGDVRDVSVQLYEGAVMARYFLILALIGTVWFAFEMFRRVSFEVQRWGVEFESDDD